MESNRQKKISGILQEDLAKMLQKAASDGGMQGTIISVSKVRVTADLTQAKIYLSVFPNDKGSEILKAVTSNSTMIRHELSQLTRHQLRRVPELIFYLDDSLEYIDQIDRSLKGDDDPIKNTDLLPKRKKK